MTVTSPEEAGPDSSDSVLSLSAADADRDIHGLRVALVGRFGGMNQREATNVLKSFQATVVDLDSGSIDWVVVGAEESPLAEAELLSATIREQAAAGELEILHETELWQRLGLVDLEQSVRRYYTPAMLAHLLGVSVRVIRRWHRRGLITPVRTLHKLPYFDFHEVTCARRLAQWIAAGASPSAIEQRLVEWLEVLPDIRRPLDQLSILVEGKQVLLRYGEGLLEPGGQLRFDFEALEVPVGSEASDAAFPPILSMDSMSGTHPARSAKAGEQDALLAEAYASEDEGDLETAIDVYHTVLARDGPRADIGFAIGELLYRLGHVVAARERFYAAIELEPSFVEARASLGCVLCDLDQWELAIAAFEGALTLHEEYPEVHYHLARALEESGRELEARHHWNRFLQMAPESPWAREAKQRIANATVSEDEPPR